MPVRGKGGARKGEDSGWVQLSLELVPKASATAMPAGNGRSEPNDNPRLPEPVGRIEFSLNPFKNCMTLLGPELCAKLGCCFCCFLCAAIGGYMIFSMIPVLMGNAVSSLIG